MTKKQQFKMVLYILIATAVVFLTIFLPIYFTQNEKPSSQTRSDIVLENLPTDSWTDFTSEPTSGTGTSADPYLVSSAEEFAWLYANPTSNVSVKLAANIDLSQHLWMPLKKVVTIFGEGYTISGMKIYTTEITGVGLIGSSGAKTTLQNFKLVNSVVYLDMDASTAACNASFLLGGSGSSNYGLHLDNVSVQNSQMYVKDFSSKARIGIACGYSYRNDININNFSAINVSIKVSSVKTSSDKVYIGGICGQLENYYSTYYSVFNNCAIENFDVNVEFTSARRSYCYTNKVLAYTSNAPTVRILNCYLDMNYTATGSCNSRYLVNSTQYSNYYHSVVLKDDNLTKVPSSFDESLWCDADTTSDFPYIFLKNDYFMEYHNLTGNFATIEFWKDYAEQPEYNSSSGRYYITKPEHLAWAIENYGPYYLKNDIDMSGKYWTPAKANLFGSGYKIKNLTLNLNYSACYDANMSNTGFMLGSNLQFQSFELVDMKILGDNITYPLNIFGVCGTVADMNNYVQLNNVGLVDLTVDIKSTSSISFYGFTCGIDDTTNVSNNLGFEKNVILNADIKIKASSVNFYAFGNNRWYSNPVKQLAFVGNIDIDAPGSTVYLAGSGTKTNKTYIYSDCLVSGNINLHNGENIVGTVYKFGPTLTSNCVEANLTISAKSINSNNNPDNVDLTEVPPEFSTSLWSEANQSNENWKYIFINVKSFINYYGLTYIKTEVDKWENYTTIPTGEGTEAKPYEIYTASEFAYLQKVCNYQKTYYINLMADVDLGAHIWQPIGTGKYSTFIFNGNYHKIKNLKINNATTEYVGLFGQSSTYTTNITKFFNFTIENAQVYGGTAALVLGSGSAVSMRNITVVNSRVVGSKYAYGLGCANTFENCSMSGEVSGEITAVGVGSGTAKNCVNYATVTSRSGNASGVASSQASDCINYGDVTGGTGACGIGGAATRCSNYGKITVNGTYSKNSEILLSGISHSTTTLSACFNYGDLVSTAMVATYIGGITSKNNTAPILDCYNFGNIICNPSVTTYAGGILGYRYNANSDTATIERCHNYGNIENCSSYAGGIAGYFYNTSSSYKAFKIDSCENSGNIQTDMTKGISGGIVGDASVYNPASITCSSNSGKVSGYSAGGLVGYLSATTTIIQNCHNIGDVTAVNYGGGLIGRLTSSAQISNCIVYCDVTTENTTYASYAGGLTGEISTGTLTLTSYIYQGNVTSSATNAASLFAKANAVAHTVSQCYVIAKVSAGSTSNSNYRASAIGYCTSGTFTDNYFNVELINDTNYKDKFGVKQASLNNTYYDITIKTSEDDEGTVYKEYVLGTDVTEENAFSNEIWYFGSQIGVLRPMPKSVFHQGDRLESESILDWIKANGYTLAA